MKRVRYLVVAAIAASLSTTMTGQSLEVTAGSRTVQDNASFEMRLRASMTALQSVLDQMLRCNNQRKIFASSADTPGRDTDGCVSVGDQSPADLSIVNETVTVNLPSVTFHPSDYPGGGADEIFISNRQSISKGVSLAALIGDGAGKAVVTLSRSGFANSSCNRPISGNINILNLQVSQSGGGGFPCHYDSSPDRHHNLGWHYNASTRMLNFDLNIKNPSGGAMERDHILNNITATYDTLRIKPRPQI